MACVRGRGGWCDREEARSLAIHGLRRQGGAMFTTTRAELAAELDEIRSAGLYKTERVLSSPQDAHVRVGGGQAVLNLCANNYLGLADHPAVIAAARAALDRWGFGLASVRFICGTQEIHRELEERISAF